MQSPEAESELRSERRPVATLESGGLRRESGERRRDMCTCPPPAPRCRRGPERQPVSVLAGKRRWDGGKWAAEGHLGSPGPCSVRSRDVNGEGLGWPGGRLHGETAVKATAPRVCLWP